MISQNHYESETIRKRLGILLIFTFHVHILKFRHSRGTTQIMGTIVGKTCRKGHETSAGFSFGTVSSPLR